MRADEGSRFHSPPNRRGAVPFSQPAQSTALLHDAAPAAPDTSATDPQAAPSIAPTGPREVSSERPRRSVGDRSEGSTKAWGGASTGGGEGAVGAARPRRPRVRRLGGGREAAERSRGDREEIERRSRGDRQRDGRSGGAKARGEACRSRALACRQRPVRSPWSQSHEAHAPTGSMLRCRWHTNIVIARREVLLYCSACRAGMWRAQLRCTPQDEGVRSVCQHAACRLPACSMQVRICPDSTRGYKQNVG